MAFNFGDNSLFGLTGSPDAMTPEDQVANEFLRRLQLAQEAQSPDQTAFTPSTPFGGMAVTRPASDNVTTVNKTPPADAEMPKTLAPSIDSRFIDAPTASTASPQATEMAPSMTLGTKAIDRPQPQVSSTPPMRRAGPFPVPGPAASGGSAPVIKAQAAPAPDFSPSFGDRLQHFGNALTGQETGSLADRVRGRQTTYDALTNLGLDPKVAEAAARNPELMKSLLSSQLGTKSQPSWTVIGQDPYGNSVYGFVNPRTMQVFNMDGTPVSSLGGANRTPGGSNLADNKGVIGNDYIENSGAPFMLQDRAKNILAGREPLPTSVRADKTALQVQELVRRADPEYNSNRYKYRQSWENSNTTVGKTRVANNTAIGHAYELSKLIPDAPDANVGPLNRVSTGIQTWWREKSNDPWMKDWQANASLLAGEIVKVATGSEGSIHDREQVLSQLNPANGKVALDAALGKYIKLLASKTDALAHDWKKNMGPYAETPKVIDEELQPVLDELKQKLAAKEKQKTTPDQPAAPAAPPPLATGQTERGGPIRGMPDQPPANAPRDKNGIQWMRNPNNPKEWVPFLNPNKE